MIKGQLTTVRLPQPSMEQWLDSSLNFFVSLLKRVFPNPDILTLFDVSIEKDQDKFGLVMLELSVDLLISFVGEILPFLYRIEGG